MTAWLDASHGVERSPIEQQIIDGLYYWDQIGPDWFRLLERRDQDVVGTVRRQHAYGDVYEWHAVVPHAGTKRFAELSEARIWVEGRA